MRNYLLPLHLITKQETITTAKSDQNNRIKLMPYAPLLSQRLLDGFDSKIREDGLDAFLNFLLDDKLRIYHDALHHFQNIALIIGLGKDLQSVFQNLTSIIPHHLPLSGEYVV